MTMEKKTEQENSGQQERGQPGLHCQESDCFKKSVIKVREGGEKKRKEGKEKIKEEELGLEAQACNPSDLGGYGRKVTSSKLVRYSVKMALRTVRI